MSKIEVNTVEPQCGTTLTVGESGGSVRTGSNNLQASDGGNLISQSGTTITLGASGDTITLASGASQTGFGRTGTVDWQTGSVKTATFTAASGEGYFADTSSSAFTMNLPAGTAGSIVSVVDYTNTFQTNNLTISPNGSQKIGGVNSNAILATEGQSVTFVYVDDTEGWKNVQDSTSAVTGNTNLVATGGTITTCGNDKIHTFTGPGTFTVSNAALCAANNVVSYLVVAGGGGGGFQSTSGGGAGGFREVKSPTTPYTASPLDGYPSSPNRITVTAQAYPIAVGSGGAGSTSASNNGTPGNVSTFSTTSSAGGGGGGSDGSGTADSGGSGGGGANGNGGGAGNTPPVTPSQGNQGGPSATSSPSGGGGGGAGAAGSPQPSNTGVAGGAGVGTLINPATGESGPGPSRYYSGGGASGTRPGTSPVASGGIGGGGDGGTCNVTGTAGTANTGGGGGNGRSNGSGDEAPGRAGGSGIVVIRYKFQ